MWVYCSCLWARCLLCNPPELQPCLLFLVLNDALRQHPFLRLPPQQTQPHTDRHSSQSATSCTSCLATLQWKKKNLRNSCLFISTLPITIVRRNLTQTDRSLLQFFQLMTESRGSILITMICMFLKKHTKIVFLALTEKENLLLPVFKV